MKAPNCPYWEKERRKREREGRREGTKKAANSYYDSTYIRYIK